MNRREFLKRFYYGVGGVLIMGCTKDTLLNLDSFIDKDYKPVIPDYYFISGYLDRKIDRINGFLSEDGVSDAFIFITDQHWEHNAQNSLPLISYIQEHTNIFRIFCGGDIGDWFGNSSFEFIGKLKSIWKGEIHCVVGNHEYLGPNGATEDKVYELFNTNPKIQIGNHNRHYYYVDNASAHIRYIILSSYSQSVDGGHHATFGYGQEQELWLKETALNVKEGWKIIIFTHLLYFIGVMDDKVTICDENILNIIDNFNGAGNILAIFQGHNHRDRILFTPKSKIPIIITTCDKYKILDDDQLNIVRTPGTIDEQAFDVVISNEKDNKIHIVRIGCPARNGIGDCVGEIVEDRTVVLTR